MSVSLAKDPWSVSSNNDAAEVDCPFSFISPIPDSDIAISPEYLDLGPLEADLIEPNSGFSDEN